MHWERAARGAQLTVGETEGTLQHSISGSAARLRSSRLKGCPCLHVMQTGNNDQQTVAACLTFRGAYDVQLLAANTDGPARRCCSAPPTGLPCLT